MSDLCLQVAGEEIHLLPERALFWPRGDMLVAADLHWGKAATFRAAGIPIPGGTTSSDLARLDTALDRTGARRLVVLGDLFHARAGRVATQTVADLRRWRRLRTELEILLVRGNHDRHAGDPPDHLRINCVNAPAFIPPFILRHEPHEAAAGYTLAGHVHPGLVLTGPGLQRERLPCFIFGARLAVLPAFGSFTGLVSVDLVGGERLFIVAEDEVVPVGEAGVCQPPLMPPLVSPPRL
ncbi:MAG: ligase-associated DNA damage response endonuclease PdeM [Gemmatimonadales bacterium]|nr:ligase-associated DNA damage response endonuclease PdeM [Gemmatimonadales bacterium]